MKSSDHTGGFASPPQMSTTADAPFTPATSTAGPKPVIGDWPTPDEEPCRPGPDPYPPGEYKRWRDGSKKRENKAKNRKAAKAARKARKR